MKELLIVRFPQLANEVAEVLREEGYEVQADAIATARIERCMPKRVQKLGYIYLVQKVPVAPGETPSADMIVRMFDRGFNIDFRASGEVYGIELIKLSPDTKVIYV